MNLEKEIRELSAPIVIVDDMYRAPELRDVVSQKSTELLRALKSNREGAAAVRGLLGGKSFSAIQMVAKLSSGKGLEKVWSAYEADRDTYRFLDVVFHPLYVKRNKDLKGLRIIEEFCVSLTGRKAATYATLESARDDLRRCAIAFVDFRISEEGLPDSEVVDIHEKYREDYQHPFTLGKASWPKIMVLISSKLPLSTNLARFRQATGVRAAFFSTLKKGDLTKDRLAKAFRTWSSNYPAAAELNSYLTTTEKAVGEVAASLINDIRRLEVHDLALLQVLRLAAEQETVQSYMTWLVAESMAARLRAHPELTQVQLGPESADAALDGKLLADSVLFEMFADVASSSITDESHLALGDVFLIMADGGKKSTEVIVAISPACDLIRCDLEYDVLCVKGTLVDSGTDLQKLIDSSKGLFGKGHHVLREPGPGKSKYLRITWHEKIGLHTVKARDLRSTKYQRRARLSESFAQEIKELALSHASRVGVPMDPAFAINANVTVRITSKRGKEFEPVSRMHDLNQEDFSPVVVSVQKVAGNKDLREVTAAFTTNFSEWLDNFLEEFCNSCDGWIPSEVAGIRAYLSEGAIRIPVKSGAGVSRADGKISFRYNVEIPDIGSVGKLEVFVSTATSEHAA